MEKYNKGLIVSKLMEEKKEERRRAVSLLRSSLVGLDHFPEIEESPQNVENVENV